MAERVAACGIGWREGEGNGGEWHKGVTTNGSKETSRVAALGAG